MEEESLFKYSPEEIEELGDEVEELNQLFKTVSELAESQDSQIGLIDDEIEEVAQKVEVATTELIQAKKYDKRGLFYSLVLVGLSVPLGWIGGPLIGVPLFGVGVAGLYKMKK